jgi:hypothetical protein
VLTENPVWPYGYNYKYQHENAPLLFGSGTVWHLIFDRNHELHNTAKADRKHITTESCPGCLRCGLYDCQNTPGITIQRSTGIFRDEAFPQPVLGCHLVISGSFALAPESGDAAERLPRDFGDMGWQNMLQYDADGKDGTRFAFHKEGVTCFFRGEWNGGSDGEPEIPREDWYKVFVLCASSVSGDDNINADH